MIGNSKHTAGGLNLFMGRNMGMNVGTVSPKSRDYKEGPLQSLNLAFFKTSFGFVHAQKPTNPVVDLCLVD